MVLDDLLDGATEKRYLHAFFAADAGDQRLQDSLDDGSQDSKGHG